MVATTFCPALFFCAPASGQGKTTITSGMARYHRNQGLDVRVFKTGPDYLDPLILEQASGKPVTQLDLWMVGEAECKGLLHQVAREADLILIEGAMGMFDGDPSGADMAHFFDMPIAIVIDARSMAQTFGAIALGLAHHRSGLKIAGVIANALGSDRHESLITQAMPESVKLLGCVRHHPEVALPERHLGLIHPHEVADIDQRLDDLAQIMFDAGITALPAPVKFVDDEETPYPLPNDLLLNGLLPNGLLPNDLSIGIAKDDAFSFIYAANIKLLEDMGASCIYFSPLNDEILPDVDAIWLPGGYPELHHQALFANQAMQQQIRDFYQSGKKMLAECGGMLYLMESLTDLTGYQTPMVGLLPGQGIMCERGGCQGMQYAPLPEGEFRAHAHHRSRCDHNLKPIAYGRRTRHPAPGEPIYQAGNLTASYLHLYFPSNPQATAKLLTRTAI